MESIVFYVSENTRKNPFKLVTDYNGKPYRIFPISGSPIPTAQCRIPVTVLIEYGEPLEVETIFKEPRPTTGEDGK